MKNNISKSEKFGPLIWFLLAGVLALLQVNFAQAEELKLRDNPIASGTHIIIGDLFDNAGSDANRVLALAPNEKQKTTFSANILTQRLAIYGLKWKAPSDVKQIVVYGSSFAKTDEIIETSNKSNSNTGEIAVLNQDVARDEEITFDMVDYIKAPSNLPNNTITDAAYLIGSRAKMNLKMNMPIRKNEIGAAIAIKRGQQVLLVHQIGGLRMTLQAKSLDNGSIGTKIRVVNLQSNRTLEAIVEANGQAKVIGPITGSQSLAAK